MSSMEYYAQLLTNDSRIEAFRKGIGAAVKPGDRVLDLGTGLGTYAFYAARAGAGEVWGVDASPIVHTGELLARENGLVDRVHFIRGRVPGVDLPTDLDVLIFEDFTTNLLDAGTWKLLAHVYENCLAPAGIVVPGRARLQVGPVASETVYADLFPLDEGDQERHGLTWHSTRQALANTPRRRNLAAEALAGPPISGPELALRPLPTPDQLAVEGEWVSPEPGVLHALALWFEIETTPGVWISNEPRTDPEPWGQTVLPLEEPLPVRPGEPVRFRVAVETGRDGAPGWMSWRVSHGDADRSGHEFAGLLAGPPDLAPGPAGPPGGHPEPGSSLDSPRER